MKSPEAPTSPNTFPTRIILLPIVHLRSEFYKDIKIPGHILLDERGVLLEHEVDYNMDPNIPIDQVPFESCIQMLEALLENEEFANDPKGHVIGEPYETTWITEADGSITLVYRVDILVSPTFPDRFHAFGGEIVKYAVHNVAYALKEPAHAMAWINLALLSPHDIVRINHTAPNADYTLQTLSDPARRRKIEKHMDDAHVGI